MRVSIWQQFSSNHSGNFQLVGLFARADRAQEAGLQLDEILRDIEELRRADGIEGDAPPTDVEKAYARQLGIEWRSGSIDWIILNGETVRNVAIYDHYVFVSSIRPNNGWQDSDVVERILDKFGGEVCVTGEHHLGDFNAVLTCSAPDELTSGRICETINNYFEQKSTLIPWIGFWTGKTTAFDSVAPSDMATLERIFVNREGAIKNFETTNAERLKEFQEALLAARNQGDDEHYRQLSAERDAFTSPFYASLPELSQKDWQDVFEARSELAANGSTLQEGQTLRIDLLWMERIDQVVPAMIKFLESQGCTVVECVVHYVMS